MVAKHEYLLLDLVDNEMLVLHYPMLKDVGHNIVAVDVLG